MPTRIFHINLRPYVRMTFAVPFHLGIKLASTNNSDSSFSHLPLAGNENPGNTFVLLHLYQAIVGCLKKAACAGNGNRPCFTWQGAFRFWALAINECNFSQAKKSARPGWCVTKQCESNVWCNNLKMLILKESSMKENDWKKNLRLCFAGISCLS